MSKIHNSPDPNEAKHCLNCETPLVGPYCYVCGQSTRSMLCSLGEAIRQCIHSLVDLDGRIYRSVFYLLFRPGRLSRDYIEGRRIPYLHPFKLLFVFVILLIFLSKLTFDWNEFAKPILQRFQKQEQIEQRQIPREHERSHLQFFSEAVPPPREEVCAAPPENDRQSPASSAYNSALTKATVVSPPELGPSAESLEDRPPSFWVILHYLQHPNEFRDILFDCLPIALVFQLPLTALMLRIIYRKPKRMYMEHLVVAVHNYAFYAFAASVFVLLELIRVRNPGFEVAIWAAFALVWMLSSLYPVLAYKQVYRMHWISTLARAALVEFLSSILLVVSITIACFFTAGVTYLKSPQVQPVSPPEFVGKSRFWGFDAHKHGPSQSPGPNPKAFVAQN